MARPRRRSVSDAVVAAEAFRRIVRSLRLSASEVERAAGITSAQLLVLTVLARQPGIGLGELAGRVLTDPSSVSVVLSRLVDGGLVSRKVNVEDARRVRLTLTSRGRATLAKAPESAPERFLEAVQGLRSPTRRSLAHGLAAVARAMGLDAEPASLFFAEASGAPRRRGKGSG